MVAVRHVQHHCFEPLHKLLDHGDLPKFYSRCCQQEYQLEFVTSPVLTKRSMRPLIQMLLDGIGRRGIW